MPHDRRGNKLETGDLVFIPARVESVQEGEEYCNVSLVSEVPMYPGDGLSHFTLNSRQVEKVPAEPGNHQEPAGAKIEPPAPATTASALLALVLLAFSGSFAFADEPRGAAPSVGPLTTIDSATPAAVKSKHSIAPTCAACRAAPAAGQVQSFERIRKPIRKALRRCGRKVKGFLKRAFCVGCG
jgi:hypothetical protein